MSKEARPEPPEPGVSLNLTQHGASASSEAYSQAHLAFLIRRPTIVFCPRTASIDWPPLQLEVLLQTVFPWVLG